MGEVNCSMDAGQPCSPDGRRFNRDWSDPRGTAEAPARRPETQDSQPGLGWLGAMFSPLGHWAKQRNQSSLLSILTGAGKSTSLHSIFIASQAGLLCTPLPR